MKDSIILFSQMSNYLIPRGISYFWEHKFSQCQMTLTEIKLNFVSLQFLTLFFFTVVLVSLWRNMSPFALSLSYVTPLSMERNWCWQKKTFIGIRVLLALGNHLTFHWLSQFLCKGKVTKPIHNNGCCKHRKYCIHKPGRVPGTCQAVIKGS